MTATAKLLPLSILLWSTGISAYTLEEQTLLEFAGQLSNFKVRYVGLALMRTSKSMAAVLMHHTCTSVACWHHSSCSTHFSLAGSCRSETMAWLGLGQQHTVSVHADQYNTRTVV